MSTDRRENPPGYPDEWEADVVLSDGGLARLRPIRPDDAELLVRFYSRVSDESKYLRFFAPYPRLSERDVQRFTRVDYVDRVAFILTVGEQMIGVGRYERLADDRAEVAFLVEDAQQGRGVAQLLLEHLAEAARERGITGFVAEVLPENERMAQVFADAGYHVSRGYEDGVLMMEFPILHTDTLAGVMERREHRAEGASIRRMLTPQRIVVVGDGARAQLIITALLSGGFRGELLAVSTDGVEVSGVPTGRSLATVDGAIDLVVASIPRDDLGAAVIDAAHKGAHAMVVLTGADIGIDDSGVVVGLARSYGIRALGPDSLGVINTAPEVGLNASPGPMPRHGSVGMFCQSAAIGVTLLSTADRQQLGISSFISTGEYGDVSGNDVMQYWEDDDDTRVCLMSIDNLGNPRKFTRVVRRLARRKPVVVYAPGRARRGSHAADRGGLGHAPDDAVDALFRQSGVIVVGRRAEMFGIAQVAARQPLPAGPRTKLIINSETLAHQLRHTVSSRGLLLAGDPVVLPPLGQQPERIARAAREALDSDDCDAVLCTVVDVFGSAPDEARWALEELAATSTKPLLAAFMDFTEFDAGQQRADVGQSLPIFEAPSDAIRALAAVSAYAHWRERDPGAVPLLDEVDADAGRRVINRALADRSAEQGQESAPTRRLTDDEATELLGAYGIDLVPQRRADTLDTALAAGAGYGWDVVLKATDARVRGRPDLASVFRNLDGPEAMRRAWLDLSELVQELGLDTGDGLASAAPVVQPMVSAGVPLRIASREDAAFGPIVEVGLAGIASDLLGDTAYRVPPLTTVDAAAMVRDLRAAPTLFGRQGSPGVEVARVQDLLHRVSEMADDLPQLSTVLLTPCIATRTDLAVLGARVEVTPTADQRDPLAREL